MDFWGPTESNKRYDLLGPASWPEWLCPDQWPWPEVNTLNWPQQKQSVYYSTRLSMQNSMMLFPWLCIHYGEVVYQKPIPRLGTLILTSEFIGWPETFNSSSHTMHALSFIPKALAQLGAKRRRGVVIAPLPSAGVYAENPKFRWRLSTEVIYYDARRYRSKQVCTRADVNKTVFEVCLFY